jgi:hypothetical protein
MLERNAEVEKQPFPGTLLESFLKRLSASHPLRGAYGATSRAEFSVDFRAVAK